MADLVITATSVVPGSGATINKDYVAGEALTAGMTVYLKAADSKLYMCQRDGTAAEAAILGVALNGAAVNQPVFVQTAGTITIGATVVAGSVYIVGSGFGGIAINTELASTNYFSIVGYASTAAALVLTPLATGIIKA